MGVLGQIVSPRGPEPGSHYFLDPYYGTLNQAPYQQPGLRTFGSLGRGPGSLIFQKTLVRECTLNYSKDPYMIEGTSTPQLPFKRPHIPTNRDHKALNRGTLGWSRYIPELKPFGRSGSLGPPSIQTVGP